MQTDQDRLGGHRGGDQRIIFASVGEAIGERAVGSLALQNGFDEHRRPVDGALILLPITPAQTLHEMGQAAAVVKIGRIAEVFVGGCKISGIVLDIEAFAKPASRRCQTRMIGWQTTVDQRDDAVDGGAAVGVEALAIAIFARRTGLVSNRLGRRKKEPPIVELFIALISLRRKILAALDKEQRGRDGRIGIGETSGTQRIKCGGGGGEI